MNNDLISREDLMRNLQYVYSCDYIGSKSKEGIVSDIIDNIDNAPTVPLPDFKEGYKQAIRDGKTNFSRWIPVSEILPEKSGDYLVRPSDGVLEDYSDFTEVMIMPYESDCEAFGWWSDRYDPVSLGYLDSDFVEFEVIAWQPLPKPYKEADNETDN